MRKLATAVPEAVSRLHRANHLPTPPTWYLPVLSNPPPTQPARSTVPRTSSDLPPQHFDAMKEGFTRRHKMKHLRERKPKAREIVYEEDRIRRQFFTDFPFEALRPVSLVEGRDIQGMGLSEEGVVDGERWETLEQRGAYPTVENTIAYTLHLHSTFNFPLTRAYSEATSQFTKLRAQHEISTLAAEAEARSYGAEFKPTPFERVHRKETAVLDTLASSYSTSSTSSTSNKYRKPSRWATTASTESPSEDEFSAGQRYMEKWKIPAPVKPVVATQPAGASGVSPEDSLKGATGEQGSEEQIPGGRLDDEAIMREYLKPLREQRA